MTVTKRAHVFRRFLLTSDGSAAAEAAIPPVMDLVHRTHATLDLVMVRARDSAQAHRAEGDDDEHSGSYLAGLSSRILASDRIRPRFALLRGDPAQSIHAYVQVHGIDLVAMGLRGAAWNEDDGGPPGIGAAAEELALSLDVPLLLVPPAVRVRSLDQVCIATDGSAQASAALASTGVLLFQTAHATLMRVVAASPSTAAPGPNGHIAADLLRLADSVRGAWRSVSTTLVQTTRPTEDLLAAVGATECGLLVICSGLATGGDDSRALGPYARDIIAHTPVPVLYFSAGASSGPANPTSPAADHPRARRN
jgi:nucleotide-binding universal stress UspA family protein